MLQTHIKASMIEAMKAKDTVKVTTLRGVMAAFTNELVAKGQKPQEEIKDEDAIVVIKRLVKQRKDSIEQFEKGGRPELAAAERAELAILETYLPATMPKDEIKKIALELKATLGVSGKAEMGKFMGALMKELKGKADGTDVKAVVEEILT
jgi:uncharacterized protein YqeY